MVGADGIDIGGRALGPGRGALLVAEIGGNHGGDAALAAAMVRAAAASGADAVKFQAYRAATFLSPLSPYYGELAGEELAPGDLAALVAQAHGLGLAAGLTVFDGPSVGLARDCGADFLKISSGDLTHHALLRLAAGADRPLMVSTGAADGDEVAAALGALAPWRGRVAVLQCASLYPAPPESANLAVMARWLGQGLTAGYSDHTLGLDAAKAALALGAMVLEKHFTTHRGLPGGDNAMSAEPAEFRELARWRDLVPALMGAAGKRALPAEGPMRPLIRRAAVATAHCPAGHVLAAGDIALRRPPRAEDGLIGPGEVGTLPGRALKRAVAAGEAVTRGDLA